MDELNLKYLTAPDPTVAAAAGEVGGGHSDIKNFKDHQLMKLSRIFREEGFDDAAEIVDRVFKQRHYKMAE